MTVQVSPLVALSGCIALEYASVVVSPKWLQALLPCIRHSRDETDVWGATGNPPLGSDWLCPL